MITSNFFDTRYAMHSLHTTAASTMNLYPLNPVRDKQIVTLTNQTKLKPRNQPPCGLLNQTTASCPVQGKPQCLCTCELLFTLLQLTQAFSPSTSIKLPRIRRANGSLRDSVASVLSTSQRTPTQAMCSYVNYEGPLVCIWRNL